MAAQLMLMYLFLVDLIEKFIVYESTDDKLSIKFLVGDIFDCSPDSIGCSFEAIWDCNALVAINPEDREKYITTLYSLLKPSGHVLLSSYVYDHSLKTGPPYSLPHQLLKSLWGEPKMTVTLLETIDFSDLFSKFFGIPLANRIILHIN